MNQLTNWLIRAWSRFLVWWKLPEWKFVGQKGSWTLIKRPNRYIIFNDWGYYELVWYQLLRDVAHTSHEHFLQEDKKFSGWGVHWDDQAWVPLEIRQWIKETCKE